MEFIFLKKTGEENKIRQEEILIESEKPLFHSGNKGDLCFLDGGA